MIRGGGGISSSCFTSGQQGLVLPQPPPMMYGVAPEDVLLMVNSSSINNINEAAAAAATSSSTHHDDIDDQDQSSSTSSFLYNLSVLKDKVHQVQSIASMFIISSSNNYNNNQPPPPPPPPSSSYSSHDKSTAMAIGSLGTLIQEIIVTASSMMFTCQQLALRLGSSTSGNVNEILHPSLPPPINVAADQQNHFGVGEERGQGFYSNHETIDQWYANDHSYNNNNTDDTVVLGNGTEELSVTTMMSYDIVELDAADLLAKYTHYCQVCGKGFKRDANLRMHMRAHGDEYKTSAALMSNYNPFNKNKNNNNNGKKEDEEGLVVAVGQNNNNNKLPRKYSCPQEGCRWNRKHAKFTPLKSMICVKNHYKRSHCPKMYVCKRCNRKQFSVLSDLRTHEKHCGDLKWQCSCGTTFSRKDKLMGHVALFIGHSPAITSLEKMGKAAHHHQTAVQMQLEDK